MSFATGKLAAFVEGESGSSVDPFLLTNIVASYSESKQFDYLDTKIQKLVTNQYTLQFIFLALGALSFHLGVPMLVAVPCGALTSALGLTFLKLRYSDVQRTFLSDLGHTQQTLISKLADVHRSELNRIQKNY